MVTMPLVEGYGNGYLIMRMRMRMRIDSGGVRLISTFPSGLVIIIRAFIISKRLFVIPASTSETADRPG